MEVTILMISCRLRVILAEKKLNRVQLSKMTGISLTTLKPLFDDTWKSIYRKTINRICDALEITHNELFEYNPEQPELFEGKKK